MRGTLNKKLFGKTVAGEEIDLYSLTNESGMEVSIATYGATIVALRVPDKNGTSADVVLGYDDSQSYVSGRSYFGGIVGRYANRIAGGKFFLGHHEYNLPQNDGPNTLHGGVVGFNKRSWIVPPTRSDGLVVDLSYRSEDGEEGFPGNLIIRVRYTLLQTRNELRIDYTATTDQDTVLNVSNHSYFNLAGEGSGDILGHLITINAKQFTPIDSTMIPTGELRSVKGTPLDFTQPAPIGKGICSDYQQILLGRGYDHNWVLDLTASRDDLFHAATVLDPISGRCLDVWTTEPGVQFYSGNFLDSIRGKENKLYGHRSGLCLETQHFPDSPNHPNFPSTLLTAGMTYKSSTAFRFSNHGMDGASSKKS